MYLDAFVMFIVQFSVNAFFLHVLNNFVCKMNLKKYIVIRKYEVGVLFSKCRFSLHFKTVKNRHALVLTSFYVVKLEIIKMLFTL